MSDEKAKILKIKDVFDLKLSIPDYQRPYKWTVKNVQQLLEDLSEHFSQNQKSYRIGTLITHKNDECSDIVDGQQRITTLFLLLKYLDCNFGKEVGLIYKHSISSNNIIKNYNFINEFISDSSLNKYDFYKYILDKCEMVCIELIDLDEAFQFFDSQNSRGKALQAYDLLKAFHLRSISNDNKEQLEYVEKWENSIISTRFNKNGDLYFIINLILFRLRRWLHYQNGFHFTTDDLDVFKGVDDSMNYPYLTSIKATQYLYKMANLNPFIYNREFIENPFFISQTIINGSLFFSYVEHYIKLYDCLFNPNNGRLKRTKVLDTNVLDFIYYNNYERTGDTYVRNLFQAIVIYYYDKFGDNHLDTAVIKILKWSYRIRMEKFSVRVETIENEVQSKNSILHYIDQIIHSKDILKYSISLNIKEVNRKNIHVLNSLFNFNFEEIKDEK